jgi:hypothetical protein
VEGFEAEISSRGDEIYIENLMIDDRFYDLTLKWRKQKQGYEIVEIR